MKLVFCFTVAALLILSYVDAHGRCSSSRKSDRKQKAASVSKNNPKGEPRFSKIKNLNKAKANRAFGSSSSGGSGRNGREPIFVPRDQSRVGSRGGSPVQSASRRSRKLARKLKAKVDKKKARNVQSASESSYPTQPIQNCCLQDEGYIVGIGSCDIIYPYSLPTVQCDYESCYTGYWWDNTEGICVEQNSQTNVVILFCQSEYPYYFLDKVTTYCNCGCDTC